MHGHLQQERLGQRRAAPLGRPEPSQRHRPRDGCAEVIVWTPYGNPSSFDSFWLPNLSVRVHWLRYHFSYCLWSPTKWRCLVRVASDWMNAMRCWPASSTWKREACRPLAWRGCFICSSFFEALLGGLVEFLEAFVPARLEFEFPGV